MANQKAGSVSLKNGKSKAQNKTDKKMYNNFLDSLEV
jgi:hypothetical protein